MMPDRVVSHIKRSFGANDLYLPSEMIEKMNTVNSVNGEFIDHNDDTRQIYMGWEKILKDQFVPIPAIDNGYTKNHFYEFSDGQVSIRHLVGSEIKHVHDYLIKGSEGIIKRRILQSLIGNTSLEKATFDSIILNRHPVIEFPKSKVSSLAEKYFSIPEDKLSYYPSISNFKNQNDAVDNANIRAREAVKIVTKKRGLDNEIIPYNTLISNKGGRKKSAVISTPFSKSIIRFFTPPVPVNIMTGEAKNPIMDDILVASGESR